MSDPKNNKRVSSGSKKKTSGLGDVIQNITDAIGVNPCQGCNERKDYLNILFPFHRVKEMTTDQKEVFGKINQEKIESKDWHDIYEVYNSTFQTQINYCAGCEGQNKIVLGKLNKLFNYEK